MRDKLWLIAGLIIGAGLFFFGVSELTSHRGVDCGGQEMKAGQVCRTYGRGAGPDRDMHAQAAKNEHAAWGSVAIGGLMGVGSLMFLITGAGQPAGRRGV